MKVCLSIHRKEGRPGYGSDGAGCEITLDLSETSVSENPESIVAEIRRGYALCEQAVSEQLARHVPPPAADPDRERLPSQGRPESLPDRDPHYHEPTAPPPRRQTEREPDRRNYDDHRDEGGRNGYQDQGRGPRNDPHNGLPKTGRELYPWAKRLEEAGCRGLVRALKDLGGRCGYPEMLKDWNHEETRAAIDLWSAMGGDAAPAARSRNGNGYRN